MALRSMTWSLAMLAATACVSPDTTGAPEVANGADATANVETFVPDTGPDTTPPDTTSPDTVSPDTVSPETTAEVVTPDFK